MLQNLTPVVKNLLILNIGVYIIQQLWPESIIYGGLFYPTTEYFKPSQFLTHMFMHGGLMHLFFNMLWLVFMGPMIERMLGDKRFITFYLVSGLGAAACHLASEYYLTGGSYAPMIGASGAVSGILLASALFFPNSEIIIFPLPIPVKMKYFLLFYIGYELIKGFNPNIGAQNIAHFAHLGGMLFAFILIKIWGVNPNRSNW